MASIIQLENISKSFGSFCAIDNVSCTIKEGATGLLGPNGAGKSTLIKILLGLLPASAGQGSVLGLEIESEALAIRAQVGYMPEDDCFFHGLSGVDAVKVSAQLSGYPATESMRRSHEILDFCGFGQERYRTVETYSTGMRQKLRFAQAIVHDPKVLILDEPTSGLDPEEREIMLRRIKRLVEVHDKTVVLCTHILPDVQVVCDSVMILSHGKIQVAGLLQHLNGPTDPAVRLRVVETETDRFLNRLKEAGFNVSEENQSIVIRGNSPVASPLIWQIARDAGVTIRSMTPAQTSLEEIFLTAVLEQPNDSI